MKKKMTVLVLTGALVCTMALPAMAADTTPIPISAPITSEQTVSLPDSMLYYGTIKEIIKSDDGAISRLSLTSDRYGDYIMNISERTAWIDSGNHKAADPSDLQVGDKLYVFHSAAATMSLPPMSAAFAVVRNIPMDAGCAQYHEVEAVSLDDGKLTITTNNGGLHIMVDADTGLSNYGESANITMADIQVGDSVMAWYGAMTQSYPGQVHANHLMLLSKAPVTPEPLKEDALTRAELVTLIHEKAGEPMIADYAMSYSDVDFQAEYAGALRWASSKGLVGGYGDGTFGPDDTVSREQMVTILWRYAGSPMLMDYPDLSQFSDVGEISRFAQPAFAWAHQKGLISAVEGDLLDPQGVATQEMALNALNSME